ATLLRALDITNGFVGTTLMMGASACGRDRIAKTAEESADLLSGSLDLDENEYQRAFNIVMTESERKLSEVVRAQCSALMGNAPVIALQALSVPILHGSVLSIQLPPSAAAEGYAQRLRDAAGILLVEDKQPIGVIDVLGQEAIIAKVD